MISPERTVGLVGIFAAIIAGMVVGAHRGLRFGLILGCTGAVTSALLAWYGHRRLVRELEWRKGANQDKLQRFRQR